MHSVITRRLALSTFVPALLLGTGPVCAQQSWLSVDYANGGTSSPDLATCVHGGYQNGDTRGCADGKPEQAAVAGDVLSGWGEATYSNGVDTQAWGTVSFGTLRAFAQSTVPAGPGFRNPQSRGAVTMGDLIAVTNSNGATSNTYQYTLVVSGTLSPQVGSFGVFPYGYAYVFVGFNTSPVGCFSCTGVVSNWTAESGQAASTVITGTFTMPVGSSFQMRASIDLSSYINAFADQPAQATADYGNTVHVYLDALTPGANTTGASGYNYASAVPEGGSLGLMAAGLGWLALTRSRRRARRSTPPTTTSPGSANAAAQGSGTAATSAPPPLPKA
jgi:hypothetical protein